MPTGKTHADVTRDLIIRSERELDHASGELCVLMSLDESEITPAQKKRLNVLANAIEAYESIHHRINEPTNAAMLAHLLDARSETPAMLAKATKIESGEIKAILSGQRRITNGQAKKIAKHFRVDVSVFQETQS